MASNHVQVDCAKLYTRHISTWCFFHMITPSYYLINGFAMKHRHKHTRALYKVVFSLGSYPRMRRRPTCTYFNTMCHVFIKGKRKKFSLEMKVSRLYQPISSLYIWFSSFRYTMQWKNIELSKQHINFKYCYIWNFFFWRFLVVLPF